MKVLFMFSGLPHYYNLILSRLNNVPGLEIVVVSPAQKGQSIGGGVYETKEGINFKCIFLEQYDSLYKKFFKGFDKILEEEKPDVVVTIFFFAFSFLYNRKVKKVMKKQGIKLIYKDIPFRLPKYEDAITHFTNLKAGINGSWLKKQIFKVAASVYRNISKKLYQRFDAHVNYVEEARNVFGSYGVDQEKIFITYNSIDNEVINDRKQKVLSLPPILPDNPYRIFHVGRLIEWKRVNMLVDAVHKLKEKYPRIELLIIGNGPLQENLEKQVESLSLASHVNFLGAIYDQELLGQYFTASSVYVLAGMGGLSLNETMAWGLPVICSVCDGTEKHLVKDGYNGKIFEDGNMDSLAEAIDYMLSDVERTKKMGQNSQEIIDNHINVHTVINGYLEAFNYVTDNKYKLSYNAPEKDS